LKIKRKILTLTPNPALDITGAVDRIVPNEKTYVYDEAHAPGGNGINVARILTRLGVPAYVSGFLGGSTGEEIAKLLLAENIRQCFIKVSEPSRINITVSNHNDHRQTRLSFQGPAIKSDETDCLLKLVRDSHGVEMLIIGG